MPPRQPAHRRRPAVELAGCRGGGGAMAVDWLAALDFLAVGVAGGIFNHISHDARGRDGGRRVGNAPNDLAAWNLVEGVASDSTFASTQPFYNKNIPGGPRRNREYFPRRLGWMGGYISILSGLPGLNSGDGGGGFCIG